MSSSMPPFDATIFLENVDYRAIDNGLHLLSKQLERIKGELRDLESLSAGGSDSGASTNIKIIPKIPTKDLPILTLPTFPVQNYRRKYTRRSNTKYEQNAEHILAQIEALETGLTFLNPFLPLPPHPLPPLDEGPVEGWKRVVKSYSDTNNFDHDTKTNTDDDCGGSGSINSNSDVGPLKQPLLTCNTTQSTFQDVLQEKTQIRKEVMEICSAFEGMKSFLKKITTTSGGGGGSASQQTTSPTTLTAKHTTTPPPRPFSAPPVTRRASAAALLQGDFKTEDEDIFVPQRSESTSTSTSTKTSKTKMAHPTTIRIPSRPQQQNQQNERGANYNLPWTRLEIRQLSELLVHFPEEEVQCRRWAKISAALGTRTPTQVSNRINKMAQKEKKKRSFGAALAAGTAGGLMMSMMSNNSNNTTTARSKEELQKEYEGLEKALKVLEENKDPENEKCHYGFRCDCCGMEPIVGRLRYQCLRCRGVDLCSKCHDGSAFARCIDHPFLKNS